MSYESVTEARLQAVRTLRFRMREQERAQRETLLRGIREKIETVDTPVDESGLPIPVEQVGQWLGVDLLHSYPNAQATLRVTPDDLVPVVEVQLFPNPSDFSIGEVSSPTFSLLPIQDPLLRCRQGDITYATKFGSTYHHRIHQDGTTLAVARDLQAFSGFLDSAIASRKAASQRV